VKLAVIQKLKNEFNHPNLPGFDEKNVLLSANHTHSSPGGYSHYAMYNISIGGFDEENFNCIVNGIYESIKKACDNLEPGHICINTGDLDDAGWNRSLPAYLQNPPNERNLYSCNNTNKKMTLLKFVSDSGGEIGTMNWFATHGTSLGNTNKLISGDNKGYASWRFEKDKGTDYIANKTFVAAFAQAEVGDVSPNMMWGSPDGIHDFTHLEFIGNRQYDKALNLYNNANIRLEPELDYRHTYVDFSNVPLVPPFNVPPPQDIDTTCYPAIGLSKAAGSTEDGPGLHMIKEGMNMGMCLKFILKLLEVESDNCHKEKQIILRTGTKPIRMQIGLPGIFTIPLCNVDIYLTPLVMPLQIIRIGHFAILAVPCEFTTMAGRRLMNTVGNGLAGTNIDEFVVASCSNAYSGYCTTWQEYSAQHYEGGSTHFGPGTLNAYQQKFSELADSLAAGIAAPAGPDPDDLTDEQRFKVKNKVYWDRAPLGKSFGSVKEDVNSTYSRGDTVKVVFWGGNPKNNFRNQESFLEVQKDNGSTWETIANDWDHETRFKWKKAYFWKSLITIEWKIPQNTHSGTYRIYHSGYRKKLCQRDPVFYPEALSNLGVSSNFQVV
jgi:neutral ceramidase